MLKIICASLCEWSLIYFHFTSAILIYGFRSIIVISNKMSRSVLPSQGYSQGMSHPIISVIFETADPVQ